MIRTFHIFVLMMIALSTIISCDKKDQEGPITSNKEKILRLSHAPSDWGKTIKDSYGRVIYYDNYKGAFSGTIELKGLKPNHQYVLSINGKPSYPGNDKLPESYGVEGYADFYQVSTDSAGNVAGEGFSVKLPSGDYHVKFFVKDPKDWKIVLYNNFLIFTVK